jgi:hypothetical protein
MFLMFSDVLNLGHIERAFIIGVEFLLFPPAFHDGSSIKNYRSIAAS